MEKITYIFGAGASAKCLPIIGGIPERIDNQIKFLEVNENSLSKTDHYDDLDKSRTKYEVQQELISDLKWLSEQSQKHASVDTFAKKLLIKRRDDELNKLKIALSVFFTVEQIKSAPDNRYDTFYATILKDDLHSFPSNVRVLSWNYDLQFELSFFEFTDDRRLSSSQSYLNMIAKYDYRTVNSPGFKIFKLNGSSTLISDRHHQSYPYLHDFLPIYHVKMLDSIVRNYCAARMQGLGIYSGLSFAWEPEYDSKRRIIELAKAETIDTTTLVVIGYSFPFFNRDVDRNYISNMKSLRKVYLQAPDADILKERFLAVRDEMQGIEVVTRFDTEQFVIPNEM